MNIRRCNRVVFSAVVALVFCLGGFMSANAMSIQVGAGSGLPAAGLDTLNSGGRLNIDNTIFPNLALGIYDVVDYEYSASTNVGNVQPFLAALTGVNQYTVLWVGPTDVSPLLGGIVTTPYGTGTETFTLAAATDVYAGFNSSNSTVFFGAGTTDHNNPDLFGIGVGSVIGNFTNNDLQRSYAFEINVAPIPEPGTWLLMGTGLIGLIGFGWRKRKQDSVSNVS